MMCVRVSMLAVCAGQHEGSVEQADAESGPEKNSQQLTHECESVFGCQCAAPAYMVAVMWA